MTLQPSRLHLFQGYGIELEYMIVDRDSLAVKSIADELLKQALGVYGGDFENGLVTWSNELVLHVIELKSTMPVSDLVTLQKAFEKNIQQINAILVNWNAQLLPTGSHPFMDPFHETKLWPHDNNEIYEIYNRIFDCRGHGWSNVQSTHLNLPFGNDQEFGKLHAAIRLVLPLLPALCASTPVLDGKLTGHYNTRLEYYKKNQAKIPSVTAHVIPEPVFCEQDYTESIFDRIKRDISSHDVEQILDPVWVNSRGAIARFDRGSIEIRIMDCQECPQADMAILALVIETIRALANGHFVPYATQINWSAEKLAQLLDQTIEKAQEAVIDDFAYLSIFGVTDKKVKAGELWLRLFEKISHEPGSALGSHLPALNVILKQGTLAQRIVRNLKNDCTQPHILHIYRRLGECLDQGCLFV